MKKTHGVSIPFIAGQWSLQSNAPTCRRHSYIVSIPFIAGQWSLPLVTLASTLEEAHVSIPFIAGQWSLPQIYVLSGMTSPRGFNPLHCGAVVASGAQNR